MGVTQAEIENKIAEYLDAISSDLIKMVEEERDNQPYKVTCQECGKDIDYDKTIDSDGDIILEIPHCNCVKEIKQ